MNGRRAAAIGAAAIAGAVGSRLAARRLIRRYETLDPEAMKLPGSRFWLNGVAVHYLERGNGFPVVLLHGFGGSTFSFRYTIPALAESYRVIAIDLPGFGYSDRRHPDDLSPTGHARLVVEFLHRLGFDRAVVLGHSMGGSVAQRMAISSLEMVSGLVLVGSVSAAASPPRVPVPLANGLMFGSQAIMALTPALTRPFVRRITYDPAFISGDVLDEYLRPGRVVGSAAALRRVLSAGLKERPVALAGIRVPTLLIWGERDTVVKPAVAVALQRGIAGARLEIIPHAGHLPLEEQPERCNQLLLDFIGEIAGARLPEGLQRG